MSQDVFICHSSKDASLAFSICNYLEENDITCWIAPRNIVGGKLYAEEIVEAIKDASVFLLVFSKNANLSKHVLSEVNCAFNANKVIIPFRIDESKMKPVFEYYLNTSQIVIGYPESDERLAALKDAVIKNIPVRDEKLKIQSLAEQLSSMTGMSMELFRSIIPAYTRDVEERTPQADDGHEGIDESKELPPPPRNTGRYDMLQNAAGEILIIIEYRESPPENPRLVYDGKDAALLYRSRESAFMLNGIADEARPCLMSVEEVLMVEIQSDDVAREYKVPVRHVKSLKALG